LIRKEREGDPSEFKNEMLLKRGEKEWGWARTASGRRGGQRGVVELSNMTTARSERDSAGAAAA